jgi:acyl-CoA thioesterase-1
MSARSSIFEEDEMGMRTGSGRTDGRVRRYGAETRRYNQVAPRLTSTLVLLALLLAGAGQAHAAPTVILAFGDSLFAGYGLNPEDSIPSKLERDLKAAGHDVKMINAGVSGDTVADGLARLDWSLADKPDLVLLELGANDALRGLDPDGVRAGLDTILTRLKTANIPAVLVGMKAPRNLGAAYVAKFDPIYPDLAAKFRIPLYPFILDGIALDPKYVLADNLHPNPQGTELVAKKMLPVVEGALPKK